MSVRNVVVFLLLTVVLNFSVGAEPTVAQGRIDLRAVDFEQHGKVRLNGYWEFYEGAFTQTYPQQTSPIPTLIKVPDSWEGYCTHQKINNGIGVGTYRVIIEKKASDDLTLFIKDIGSSYKLWINGKLVIEAGKADTQEVVYKPAYGKQTISLPTDTNTIELVIEVANFSQLKGGIKTNIILVRSNQAWLEHEREAITSYACLGIILIIGFLHLVLFLFDKKELASLNFGLFCFTIFIFLIFRNRYIYYFFHNIDWETGNKIEFVAEYLALPLFYRFFYQSFPRQFGNFFKSISWILSGALIVIVLTSNMLQYSITINYFHIILLMYIGLVIVGITKAVIAGEGGIHIIFPGFIVFMATLINDILHVQNIINTGNFVLLGVLGFIISQALFLAWKSVNNRRLIVSLSDNLSRLNESLKCYVPSDFLKLLGKQSITDVALGNHTDMELTIMFSDIRAFTSISEKLCPAEAFDFINDYLRVMAPIITKHNGFIDKYMGDGIMALFPNAADDALLAGKEMLEELKQFNIQNEKKGKPIIAIGIGLHSGSCILGTVGEPKRMDTTVISDSVNLAARIEALTKFYKTPFIISEETYNLINSNLRPKMRFIGEVMVKGKSTHTQLYKVFLDKEYDPILLDKFDEGITKFYAKQFVEASEIFSQLLPTPLNDGILHFYLHLSEKYGNQNLPDDWKVFQTFEY